VVKLLTMNSVSEDSHTQHKALLNFLMDWLVNHIRNTDLLLGNHLRA